MADEEQTQEAAPAKEKGGMMGIVFALVNLIVMFGGAFWIYSSTLGFVPQKMREDIGITELIKARESRAKEAVLFLMEPFNVNLAGRPKRQLTVEMHLEMLDEEGFEEVVTMTGETRDAIMRLLAQKTFLELQSIQGKLFLKDQIATTVNRNLKNGVVKDIFFSQFLVQ